MLIKMLSRNKNQLGSGYGQRCTYLTLKISAFNQDITAYIVFNFENKMLKTLKRDQVRSWLLKFF